MTFDLTFCGRPKEMMLRVNGIIILFKYQLLAISSNHESGKKCRGYVGSSVVEIGPFQCKLYQTT